MLCRPCMACTICALAVCCHPICLAVNYFSVLGYCCGLAYGKHFSVYTHTTQLIEQIAVKRVMLSVYIT